MVTYNDIIIYCGDQEFIDELAKKHGVDYGDCEYSGGGCFANNIIYYIYSDAINSLDVSETTRENLIAGIFTNCLDSKVSISSDDIDEGDYTLIQDLDWVNVY